MNVFLFQMALQILLILHVIMIFCTQITNTYPVYGTKRYGRSASVHRNWAPYQQMTRTQKYPVNYYELYPSSQNYQDGLYYPQENYPVYYPARTSKYEVYQAVLPYYYGERPISRTNYDYYGYEDNEPTNFENEVVQDAARDEESEGFQPFGQEMLYETDNVNTNDNLDDVNAAFFQNLIMSQLYKDAVDNQKDVFDPVEPSVSELTDNAYGKWKTAPAKPKQTHRQEDDNVRELKKLAGTKDDKQTKQYKVWSGGNIVQNTDEEYVKRASVDVNFLKQDGHHSSSTTSTTVAPKITDLPKTQSIGQKEEVLVRPATPVRHPFSAPVLDMMTKNDEDRKRTPSVYDTIKHMLDMEKNMENVS